MGLGAPPARVPFDASRVEHRMMRPGLSRNDAVGPGGTTHLAVLGGNLPPSRAHGDRTPLSLHSLRSAIGLAARQNGPVARSTQTPIESFRLSWCDFSPGETPASTRETRMLPSYSRMIMATVQSANRSAVPSDSIRQLLQKADASRFWCPPSATTRLVSPEAAGKMIRSLRLL